MTAAVLERVGVRVGRYRWTICALLFFATTINYIDRQVLGILAPTLQRDLGWNEQQFGDIVSWFTIAYALGFLVVGRIMDRVGTRRGFRRCDRDLEYRGDGARVRAHRRGIQRGAVRAWDSVSRATSPRLSRLSPSGSRAASARSRRASSTPVRMSARS
jgi:hypothetical protein